MCKMENFTAEKGRFDLVENKRSQRPDLHAFLLLDELFPNPGKPIVKIAEHRSGYLDAQNPATRKNGGVLCESLKLVAFAL